MVGRLGTVCVVACYLKKTIRSVLYLFSEQLGDA